MSKVGDGPPCPSCRAPLYIYDDDTAYCPDWRCAPDDRHTGLILSAREAYRLAYEDR